LGTFPAFGLGWIVTKEDFMANVKGMLIEITWRFKLGNQNVPLNKTYSSGLTTYLGGSIFIDGTIIRLTLAYHGKYRGGFGRFRF
jgi:hypothetical protein